MKRLAIVTLALAAYGCDDAPIQEAPELPEELDAQVIDAGDAARAIELDGGLDASLDASFDASMIDAGYVEEVDAAADTRDAAALPYARGVQRYSPGSNAGYGQERYPEVVLGPPSGKGNLAGGLDVLSLGVGGEIVLDFGARTIVDRPGADFIVFENPFHAGGSAAAVFAELGEVSVSNDLTTWLTFPCSLQPTQPGMYPGCAGWTPTLAFDPFTLVPLDPAQTGGDAFDLATVQATSARYLRVRDLATSGQGSSAGFDLDAVGVIHAAP
ncbi:MAG: cell surface protein [Polyangiales bacterium]